VNKTVMLAALAALSACTTAPQTQPPANIVTNVHPHSAGSGVVQRVMPTPVLAGAASPAEPLQRLEIKMDDGKIQYVDTASRDIMRGSRIVLTEDRVLRKL